MEMENPFLIVSLSLLSWKKGDTKAQVVCRVVYLEREKG
jgi:hypothetical protein